MKLKATNEEIDEYLEDVRRIIKKPNNLIMSDNREKNKNFYKKYKYNRKKVIDVLNKLKKENFRYKTKNEHEAYEYEYLYVFSIYCNKNIEVYLKINKLTNKVIIVSMHEAEYKV
ncbi:MAG: hypothetical protein E7171_07120 [Firmicutes bacterium]|nr:hypothetical protein [Bacillota bacterium]